jgi:hypothetical protein
MVVQELQVKVMLVVMVGLMEQPLGQVAVVAEQVLLVAIFLVLLVEMVVLARHLLLQVHL